MQPKPFSKIKTSERLIHKWLTARQELIVSLNHLCSLRPFEKTQKPDVFDALQEFCQLLVDYVSMGHFEIYEHITHVVELCQHPMTHVPRCLLQSLMDTTVVSLDFNDKYQALGLVDHLDRDLSALALKMAQRLEWEDELIEIYRMAKAWGYYPAKTA